MPTKNYIYFFTPTKMIIFFILIPQLMPKKKLRQKKNHMATTTWRDSLQLQRLLSDLVAGGQTY